MTPAGIEPATFRFVAQHLNHCATAVPPKNLEDLRLYRDCHEQHIPLHETVATNTGSKFEESEQLISTMS